MDGTEAQGSAEGVAPAETTAAETVSQPNRGVDLTQLPEFRQAQSAWDRKMADMARKNQELTGQVETLMSRIEQNGSASMNALAPEEQVAYLKRQLEDVRRQQERERERANILTAANKMLSEAGMTWASDPRLQVIQMGGEIQLGELASTIIAIQRDAIVAERQRAEAARNRQAQSAVVNAVASDRAAGVAATSSATGATVLAPPASSQDALIQAMRAKRASLIKRRVLATSREFRDFTAELIRNGLTQEDLA